MSKEIRALFDELKRELTSECKDFKETIERDFRRELRDIKTFLATANKEYEEIKEENQSLRASNAELKAQCSDLARQVNGHENRILRAEQYSQRTNVEIKGIPYESPEDLLELVIKIGKKVGVPLVGTDIGRAHRVPTAHNPSQRNVVVQFEQRQSRDNFLMKARAASLKCSDLGIDSRSAVFVNEHVCPELKRLLGQATVRKRETGWKYVWVCDGKIFARQTDNAPKIKIENNDDVNKMHSSS
ncbi:hypothetical protein MTO96_025982 [Rhipicephalus appendiculatus]